MSDAAKRLQEWADNVEEQPVQRFVDDVRELLAENARCARLSEENEQLRHVQDEITQRDYLLLVEIRDLEAERARLEAALREAQTIAERYGTLLEISRVAVAALAGSAETTDLLHDGSSLFAHLQAWRVARHVAGEATDTPPIARMAEQPEDLGHTDCWICEAARACEAGEG